MSIDSMPIDSFVFYKGKSFGTMKRGSIESVELMNVFTVDTNMDLDNLGNFLMIIRIKCAGGVIV